MDTILHAMSVTVQSITLTLYNAINAINATEANDANDTTSLRLASVTASYARRLNQFNV